MRTRGRREPRNPISGRLATAVLLLLLTSGTAACSGPPGPGTEPGTGASQAQGIPALGQAPDRSAERASPEGGPEARSGNGPPTGTHREVCPESGGDEGKHRLAEHVYDAAVARYLLENASSIGRRMPPESRDYAMMLLADENSYEMCVAAPQRCLSLEFTGTSTKEERDALLSGKAAYAYQRALACLQRAGDAWSTRAPAQGTAPIPNLDDLYRTRILARLVGNMMPVGLLSDSSFFGTGNQELYHTALTAKQDCLRTLSAIPADQDSLVERISADQTAALDCVEDMRQPFPNRPYGSD